MQGKKFELSKKELEVLTNKHSDTEISKLLEVTISTIFLLRKQHNVLSFSQKTECRKSRKSGEVLKPGQGVHHKHQDNLNRHYFDLIDTEFKAYFLGLLAADGHICDSNQNCFMAIELQKPDHVVLEILARELNHNLEVKSLSRTGKKDSGRIKVYSRDLVYSLIDKGMTFNTENHGAYSALSSSLHRHFIRGVVDGDGHISAAKSTLFIGSCSFELLAQIAEWTQKALDIPFKIKHRTLESGKAFHQLSFTSTVLFVKWLYSDCMVAIPRKLEQASIWISRS